MSRRPSPNPNVTPFIPPLSSPNPSPQLHSHPGSAANTPGPTTHYLSGYPSTPYAPYLAPPPVTPAVYPSAIPPHSYPPFSTPYQPPIPPNGLSADYTGYPQFLTPTPLAPHAQLPPQNHPPASHATPWSAPVQPPAVTPWAQPVHLPQYPQFGAPPAHPAWYSNMTPNMPFGAFSPDPWLAAAMGRHPAAGPGPGWPAHPQAPQPPAHHPGPLSRTTGFTGDRVDPFLPGSSYGPVLTPFLVGVVKANMKLNPLITPLPDDGSDKPHLRWNMLYTSNYCQRSDDKPHISWSKGRESPATFPRVTSLRVITDLMPWTIEVVAHNPAIGVTCGEVIDSVSDCLYHMASATDYNALPDPRKRVVSESYHYNRSVAADVPGGRLKHGMMRLDFLCKHSMFGGIEVNPDVVRRAVGVALPCVFVLRCLKRPVLSESEARQQRERTRSASRTPGHGDTKTTQSTAEPGPSASS